MASRLDSFSTQFNADSVECCPIEGLQHNLVCANYQLDESTRTRNGALYLFDVSQENLNLKQTIECCGVLDAKWCHQVPLLGSAGADGVLTLYKLDDQTLKNVSSLPIDESSLCLSLDWSNRLNNSDVQVIVSMSNCDLVLVKLEENNLEVVSSWKAHDFEAWIAAFDYWDTNIIYSGGDDCILKKWDTRMDTSRPVALSKRHSMGVCSIQSNPHSQNQFCSGSYDEYVHVWDNRSLKTPVCSFHTGGGVWRLKWHPTRSDVLLAACMHNGFSVWQTTGSEGSQIAHYSHESLAYGTDWVYTHQTSHALIGACSFYDKFLTLWSAELPQ
eukprot:GILI01035494.1.p1 GENE.GILI01035494.1~~GILI01035494.1.p1  ORF type:complete len:329 (-),score=2.49 GILI01035494.1:147-1133(-)